MNEKEMGFFNIALVHRKESVESSEHSRLRAISFSLLISTLGD
jgi:hypothetical protein